MKQGLIRVAIALVFISTIGLAIGGHPIAGQAGEPPKQYFPLMSANVPAQTDPAFRDYVGVGVSDDDGDAEIYTIRGDDSDLRQLTHNELEESSPGFSPNGTRIAFSRILPEENGTTRYQLVLINVDGSHEQILFEVTNSRDDYKPLVKWSPSGQHLLFYELPEMAMWVVGIDGSTQALGAAYSQTVQWSPDGRYVNFTSEAEILHVRNVFTQTTITVEPQVGGRLWAPDSRSLLVWNYIAQQARFYIMQPDDSELRLVLTGNYRAFGWIRDGRELLFQSDEPFNKNFYTVSRSGGVPVALTDDRTWYTSGSIDSDHIGLLYQVVAASPRTGLEHYWLPFDTKKPRLLYTSYHNEWVSNPRVSQDRTTLLYDLKAHCPSAPMCGYVGYKVRLDDETSTPVAAGRTGSLYLPMSSNRAVASSGGYPHYSHHTITMVQIEPLATFSLHFPTSPTIRYITEWKYLP